MEMHYGISSLGQLPSSCTMQPWVPIYQEPRTEDHSMGSVALLMASASADRAIGSSAVV